MITLEKWHLFTTKKELIKGENRMLSKKVVCGWFEISDWPAYWQITIVYVSTLALNGCENTVDLFLVSFLSSYLSSWRLCSPAHLPDRWQQRAEWSQSSSDTAPGPDSEWPSGHWQVLRLKPILLFSVLDTQTEAGFHFGNISDLVFGSLVNLKLWRSCGASVSSLLNEWVDPKHYTTVQFNLHSKQHWVIMHDGSPK